MVKEILQLDIIYIVRLLGVFPAVTLLRVWTFHHLSFVWEYLTNNVLDVQLRLRNIPITRVLLLFGFLFSISAFAQSDSQGIRFTQVDVVFSNELNDTQQTENLEHVRNAGFYHWLTDYTGKFAYKANFAVKSGHKTYDPTFLVAYLPATYEVYIDDQLIGRNGNLGRDESGQTFEQTPGFGRNTFLIPRDLLRPGEHTLEFRCFREDHVLEIKHTNIYLTTFSHLINQERTNTIVYGSYLFYFILGLFFLSNYFLKKEDLAQLYIGALCLLFSTYALNKMAYYNFGLNYYQTAAVLQFVFSINYIICIFAHLAVFESLKYKRIYYWGALLIPIIASAILYKLDSFKSLNVTFTWLFLVGLTSLILKRNHALKVVLITGLLATVYTFNLFKLQQFVTISCIMLYVVLSIGFAFYKQHKEKQESELKNARLNLELVKSKIQPHFVLNSITSAMEWIESDPPQGVKFLNALAKEFELLSSISEQKLIRLGVELESCRSYLKVMEFRKKANYTLKADSVGLSKTLPPSIIRNLLENAITHNSYGKKAVIFCLTETSDEQRRIYEFKSPIAKARRHKTREENFSEGTGIKYIKARLTESYHKKWKFEHGPEGDVWVSRIEIAN